MTRMMQAATLTAALFLQMAGAATAQPAEPVGVAACDEFLGKYEVCIGQLPAAERPQRTEQLVQMRANWSAIATKPRGKEGLEAICKQTAGFIAPSLKPLGCAF